MKKIPALFISEELKRKQAKEAVLAAVEAINSYGPLAGVSDRSLFEFKTLSTFITREINYAQRVEEIMDRSPA